MNEGRKQANQGSMKGINRLDERQQYAVELAWKAGKEVLMNQYKIK